MKNYCCIILLSILASSCSKWLDEKPSQNLAVPTTLEDFQVLLDNASKFNLQSASFHEIASDGHYVLPNNASTLDNIQFNAYSWTREKINNSTIDWTKTYSNILTCNIILEGLTKIEVFDLASKVAYDNVMGQALMFRAIKFYEIAQSWAPPIMEADTKKEYGIPLRLESDINIPTRRSTVQQTYDQIVSDLLVASKLLPLSPLYKTRPSKPAAFAMLSRIYLAMEKYENAGRYADSCLSIKNELMDFNLKLPSETWPIERFNEEVIMHTALINYSSLGSRLVVEQSLYEKYQDGDLRKTIFFKENSNGTIGFKGNYSGSVQPFCGLAIDEQFLIRAECYAREGKIEKAMEDLNYLRKKRWDHDVAYISLPVTNQEEALIHILLERRKELLLRGVRWSDLRRLNRDPRFKVIVTREIGTSTYTLEPESYKYTLPIPDDIIMQTGIKQNPGWE